MQEQTNSTMRSTMRRVLKVTGLSALIVLLMVTSAGGAYWIRGQSDGMVEKAQADAIKELQSNKASLQKQLTAANKLAATTTPVAVTTCSPKTPSATVVENIEASITSKNTAALGGYMAATVQDVYAAADAIPAKSAADSVTDITSFVADQITGDWSFPVPASSLATYQAGSYKQYFPSTAIVGGSTRHRVISFNFDCNSKISTVFMAADDAVL